MMLLKKLFLCLTLLSCAAAVQADMYYDSCDPCCYESCDPCCDLCSDITVYGDYLYWRARRCELDYAIPYDSSPGYFIGDIYHVCPQYDSGFRVGFKKGCGDLDIEARYTWYQSSSFDEVRNADGFLAGSRLAEDLTAVSQGIIRLANSDWDIHYNVVDVLAGYDMDVGRCFDFRLFGGLKLAFIKQKLNTLYSTSLDVNDAANTFDSIHDKIDMDGYGVSLGFETTYHVWNCLGIYGNFSYDVLISEFDRHFIYQNTSDGGQTFTTTADLKDECWRTVSVFDLAIGLMYNIDTCWCTDLFIAAGYEFHHYINMADFVNFQTESGEYTFDRKIDALGLDGLFVRLGFGF